MSYQATVREDLQAEGIGVPVRNTAGKTRYIFAGTYPAMQPDELDDEEWNMAICIDNQMYKAISIDWDWSEQNV